MRSLTHSWPLFILIIFALLWGGCQITGSSHDQNIHLRLQQFLTDIPILEEGKPTQAKQMAYHIIELADSLDEDLAKAQGYYWLSKILLTEHSYSEEVIQALSYNRISLELLRATQASDWQARTLGLQASIFSYLHKQDSLYQDSIYIAWNLANQFLSLHRSSQEDSLRIQADLLKIKASWLLKAAFGVRPPNREQAKEADSLLQISLDIYRHINYLEGQGICLRNLARLNGDLDSFHLAYPRFEEALQINETMVSNIAIYNTLLEMGDTYIAQYVQSRNEALFVSGMECYEKARALPDVKHANVYLKIGIAQHYHAYFEQMANGSPLNLGATGHAYLKGIQQAKSEQDLLTLGAILNNYQLICQDLESDFNCQAALTEANAAYSEISQASRQAQVQAERDMADFYLQSQAKKAAQKRSLILLISGGILLALIAVFLFYYSKIRIKHYRQQLSAQLKALQAQMNPHFISNSLSAIESLINTHKNREAASYLVEFSRLARMILSHCQQDSIKLQQEIDMLGMYLSLEKLRMSQRLNYHIYLDEGVDPWHVSIPPMILQPFVENAIWHGLKNKKGEGTLSISFQKESGDVLLCVVEDNGVGRQKAQELKNMSAFQQISYSTRIIEERIDVLKQQIGGNLSIIDLKDPQGNPTGTRVEVRIHLSPTN